MFYNSRHLNNNLAEMVMHGTLSHHNSWFATTNGEILGWVPLGTIDGMNVKNKFTDWLTFRNKLYFIYQGVNIKNTLHI